MECQILPPEAVPYLRKSNFIGGTFIKATADYNMDMTVSVGGKFQMIIKDGAGIVVLDYTLIKGQTPDSKSGVTATGTPGTWTIIINVTNFNGNGSYDLSRGA